jgi:hypothetical protein
MIDTIKLKGASIAKQKKALPFLQYKVKLSFHSKVRSVESFRLSHQKKFAIALKKTL